MNRNPLWIPAKIRDIITHPLDPQSLIPQTRILRPLRPERLRLRKPKRSQPIIHRDVNNRRLILDRLKNQPVRFIGDLLVRVEPETPAVDPDQHWQQGTAGGVGGVRRSYDVEVQTVLRDVGHVRECYGRFDGVEGLRTGGAVGCCFHD